MPGIDWRALYAANQAAVQRARRLPASMPPSSTGPSRPPRAGRAATPAPRRRGTADNALVHVPATADPAIALPLVCMLHGCTQDPAAFAAATCMNAAADRAGFAVVYPGQARGANPQSCWNWFSPEHQRRGGGEPARIAGIVRATMAAEHGCRIDPARVVVAGLSSGGAMAAILAACYPDLFAAVAIHSGIAYAAADTVGAAFAAMAQPTADARALGRAAHAAMGSHARPVPTMVIHGSADRTVDPANARHVLLQAMTANHLAAPELCERDPLVTATPVRDRAPDGHAYATSRWSDRRGRLMHVLLEVEGLGHAWSGGTPGGSFTDPRGPSATTAITEFFAETAFERRR